jgi:hypothetical protein
MDRRPLQDVSLEALLFEFRARTTHGLAVLGRDAMEESLYLWWGNRTLALGATARLAHGINSEFDDESRGVEEIDLDQEEPLDSSSGTGQYL